MTTLDFLYVALLTTAFLLDGFVLWPSFLRRSQRAPARARLWIWSCWMSMLWTLVAVGVASWFLKNRTWEALGLVAISGWKLWAAVGLVLALAIAFGGSIAKLVRIDDSKRKSVRSQYGTLAVMLPHTRAELYWFVALSLTAGFCEEFIFRGYLIWFFQPTLGLWGAAGMSVIAFAAAHAYQGMSGIVKTGILGTLLTIVVLACGSIWPAIALHALIDIGAGLTAWLVLCEVPTGTDTIDGLGESV
ncbi:MAG: CPBP family intramembrane glutamic endopeptidase [Dokdonella sp.]